MMTSMIRRLAPALIGLALWATPAAAQGPEQYVVQPGDTLSRIASRYGTTVAALIEVNAIPNPNVLRVGQSLQIGGSAASRPAAPAAPAAPAQPSAAARAHTVQRGETLGLIAQRYGVSVAAISGANGITNPSRIFPGQRLVIPGGGTAASVSAPAAAPAAASVPVRITAAKIGLDARVISTGWTTVWRSGLSQSEWVVADYAAGWHTNSAPVGSVGNTVISGHHNIKGEVFRWLVNLAVGDQITLYKANGERVTYAVTESHILPERDQPMEVRLRNAQWIAPTADNRLTLVTCWPYTDNTHRLIVVAKPVN